MIENEHVLLDLHASDASRISCQDVCHDMARLNTCQAEIKTLSTISEPLVIDAQQVKDGRMEIAHMDRILSRVETEVISRSVTDA